MAPTKIDPRELAQTLGVSTFELATFLRSKAAELMLQTTAIAENDPWFSHEDADRQLGELDGLTEQAKQLMVLAFEFARCDDEDNPIPEED